MVTSEQPVSASLRKRVSLNTLWILLARTLSQLLLLVFTILVARTLGETGLGQYAFIASVLFLGNVATTFGLDTMIIREFASQNGRRGSDAAGLLTTALLLQLGLSAAFIAGVWLLAVRLPNQTPTTALALRIASLSLLPLAFSTVYSAVLRAYERMDLYMIFNLVTAGIMVGGAFLVLPRGGGLVAVSITMVLAQLGGALVAGLMSHLFLPDFGLQLRPPSRAFVRQVLGVGLVLALLMVAGVAYQRMAVLILSLTQGDAITGWYSAAARLSEALKLIPAAFFGAVFPMMARAREGGHLLGSSNQPPTITRAPATASATSLYQRSVWLLIGGAILLAALTFAAAGLLIPLLFGPGYDPAIQALRVLVWGLPFTVLAVSLSFELVTAGQDRAALLAMSLSLLLAAPLMWLAAEQWGLTGVSIATVAAELIQIAVLLLVRRRMTIVGRRGGPSEKEHPFA